MRQEGLAERHRRAPDGAGRALPAVVALFMLVWSGPGPCGAGEERPITVVFRYDDYSALSRTDTDVRVIDAFRQHGLPCTFAVIPCESPGMHCFVDLDPPTRPLGTDKAQILKKAMAEGTVEIAQHGWSHHTVRESRGPRDLSEFATLAYETQRQRIASGKKLLESLLGSPITIFVPPFNTYDLNTLRALTEEGFRVVSADGRGPAHPDSALEFLPSTCELHEVRRAVALARCTPGTRPVIVVLFHPYSFHNARKEPDEAKHQQFAGLLAWVAAQADVQVRTVGQAVAAADDAGPGRLASYRRCVGLAWLLPPSFARAACPTTVYWSSDVTRGVFVRSLLAAVAFYGGLLAACLAVAFLVARAIFARPRVMVALARYGAVALVVAFAAYAFRDASVSYKGAGVLTVLVGGCAGVWVACLRLRRRGRLTWVPAASGQPEAPNAQAAGAEETRAPAGSGRGEPGEGAGTEGRR